MFENYIMTDPIFYISMLLGFGGIYVLISSFQDDDDDDSNDGERYIYNYDFINQSWYLKISKPLSVNK